MDNAVGETSQKARDIFVPKALQVTALILVVAAVVVWLTTDRHPDGETEPYTTDASSDYQVVSWRELTTDSDGLSDTYVPVDGALRAQVLQQLAEFGARWKIADPRIAVVADESAADVAEQLTGWLEHHDLAITSASSTDASATRVPRETVKVAQGLTTGMLIHAHSKDESIARDLALALSPAIGGDVALLIDSNIDAGRLKVRLLGSPQFTDEGVAYFSRS